ncbi:ABC transporter permease [Paenibacillus terrigena]|uniref:ABC transporter permease n=1 Tax=Paenibacillus terrigena TaxID=369333 RepID=UPI0028D25ED4|nr:ABC transporter permease [Paenibacillus terrigena]
MNIKSFMGLMASERLKLSRSLIWILVLVSPLISLIIGLMASLDDTPARIQYVQLQSIVFTLHAMLLLPILTGIFSAFVCRYEHSGGGWKSLLCLPVSRTGLFMAKFSIVVLLLAVTQLLMLASLAASVSFHDIPGGMNWELTLPAIISGWVACLPLAALQLWVSIGWSSFAAPLAINVALTLPNMLIVNSAQFGPYYPWAQPSLAMLTHSEMDFGAFTLPIENILITITCSFILFFIGGLLHLKRKEV